MRLPKNFQPVGTSKNCRPSSWATLSSAPLVGMLLATPCTLRALKMLRALKALNTDYDYSAPLMGMLLATPCTLRALKALNTDYDYSAPLVGMLLATPCTLRALRAHLVSITITEPHWWACSGPRPAC